MAAENSFDIVSNVDLPEVSNAIQQALKEIHQRYDLKGSHSDIVFDGKDEIVLTSADEYKLTAVIDVLQSKFVKRGVSLKSGQGGPRPVCVGGSRVQLEADHRHRDVVVGRGW